MAEEIGFENGRNSNSEGLVTLTLTLDPAIRHTVVYHSSTYIPNFIQIEKTFCGRTDGRTEGRTFFPSNIIRSTFGSRPKNNSDVNNDWARKDNDQDQGFNNKDKHFIYNIWFASCNVRVTDKYNCNKWQQT